LQQQQQQQQKRILAPVPCGVPLPPRPAIPLTNARYQLKKIAVRISKCNGCGNAFKTSGVHPPDNTVVICRKERDYYPHINDDGSKSWHLGREQNRHYHLSTQCIQNLLPLVCDTQITDDLRQVLQASFGMYITAFLIRNILYIAINIEDFITILTIVLFSRQSLT
jgi:hypothetical protein